jgi:hypothetical protein
MGKSRSIWTDSHLHLRQAVVGEESLPRGDGGREEVVHHARELRRAGSDVAAGPAVEARGVVQVREIHRAARPFPPSIFRDKNRRDIGKSQSIWTDSKMETAGSPPVRRGVVVRHRRVLVGDARVGRAEPRAHEVHAALQLPAQRRRRE